MRLITSTLLILLLCISMQGQTVDSGSTGADGPFNPPSQVPAGTQVQGDCASPSGCTVTVSLREPPNHIFNFTTVTIAQRITVKFRRNAANTPVFILAQGNVTINGVIDISGEDAVPGLNAARGGPGGFGGGVGSIAGSPTGLGGAGSGPGGGGVNSIPFGDGTGGGFGTPGAGRGGVPGGVAYGTPELQLLIGGSGGGGGGEPMGAPGLPLNNGAGGAGALLIASSGIIDLVSRGPNTNNIRAEGGRVNTGGSGGAVRLVATTLRGSGNIFAAGGPPAGGSGRIRLESFRFEFNGLTSPPHTFNQPGPIFPPITPTLRVVSIGGVPLPAQPTFDLTAADVTLPESVPNPVAIELEATHVPTGTRANIILAPQLGSGARVITPVVLTGAAGQPKRGTVSVTVPRGMGFISAVIDSVAPEP